MAASRLLAFALAAVALDPGTASAHRMLVDAKVGPADVTVEVGYEDDIPAEDATVKLLDAAGAVVATAKTDARGVARVARPKAGTYTVAADDGGGHRTKLALTVPESDAEIAEARTERRNRWATGAAGVAVILAGSLFARRLLARKPQPVPGATP